MQEYSRMRSQPYLCSSWNQAGLASVGTHSTGGRSGESLVFLHFTEARSGPRPPSDRAAQGPLK
jgi:hypothetical protein